MTDDQVERWKAEFRNNKKRNDQERTTIHELDIKQTTLDLNTPPNRVLQKTIQDERKRLKKILEPVGGGA